MIERGIARDGYPVLTVAGEQIGEITSGSPAPFLKKNIALAYVPIQYAAIDEVRHRRDPRPAGQSPRSPHPFLQTPAKIAARDIHPPNRYTR